MSSNWKTVATATSDSNFRAVRPAVHGRSPVSGEQNSETLQRMCVARILVRMLVTRSGGPFSEIVVGLETWNVALCRLSVGGGRRMLSSGRPVATALVSACPVPGWPLSPEAHATCYSVDETARCITARTCNGLSLKPISAPT